MFCSCQGLCFFACEGLCFLRARGCLFFSSRGYVFFLPRFLFFSLPRGLCFFFLTKGLRFFFSEDSFLLPSDCGVSCQGVVISSKGLCFFRAERLCFFRANGSSLFLAKVLCLCLARGCVFFFCCKGLCFLLLEVVFFSGIFLQGVVFFCKRLFFFAKGCCFLRVLRFSPSSWLFLQGFAFYVARCSLFARGVVFCSIDFLAVGCVFFCCHELCFFNLQGFVCEFFICTRGFVFVFWKRFCFRFFSQGFCLHGVLFFCKEVLCCFSLTVVFLPCFSFFLQVFFAIFVFVSFFFVKRVLYTYIFYEGLCFQSFFLYAEKGEASAASERTHPSNRENSMSRSSHIPATGTEIDSISEKFAGVLFRQRRNIPKENRQPYLNPLKRNIIRDYSLRSKGIRYCTIWDDYAGVLKKRKCRRGPPRIEKTNSFSSCGTLTQRSGIEAVRAQWKNWKGSLFWSWGTQELRTDDLSRQELQESQSRDIQESHEHSEWFLRFTWPWDSKRFPTFPVILCSEFYGTAFPGFLLAAWHTELTWYTGKRFWNPSAPYEPTASCPGDGNARCLTVTHCALVHTKICCENWWIGKEILKSVAIPTPQTLFNLGFSLSCRRSLT